MADQLNIAINPQQLEAIVATAFGEPAVKLGEWQVKPLHGGLEAGNRLLRVSGLARTSSGDRSWSLVLKIVTGTAATEGDPGGFRYWKREALFYQSGLLSDQFCGLVAPRCYQVSQHDREFWLWLEEVKDELGKPWPVAHYREVARCLGCFNGAYLAGKPLPQEPWLTRRWLRGYAELAAPAIQDLPELRKLPFFQRAFAAMNDDFLLEAWERRGEFIGALERLPQTFCHQDAFIGNLFWRRSPAGEGQVVGLDWAYAGIAAVGEELAPLVAMAGLGRTREPADGFQVYQICLEGYLAGLAEVGWTADPQQVRFSSLTALIYRYLYGAGLGELWSIARDERTHPMLAAAFGVPSFDMVIGTLASTSAFHREAYQQISPLLKQFS